MKNYVWIIVLIVWTLGMLINNIIQRVIGKKSDVGNKGIMKTIKNA